MIDIQYLYLYLLFILLTYAFFICTVAPNIVNGSLLCLMELHAEKKTLINNQRNEWNLQHAGFPSRSRQTCSQKRICMFCKKCHILGLKMIS